MLKKRKLRIVQVFSKNKKNNCRKNSKICVIPIVNNKIYTIMFDGGSRGNPGNSGCGFVIYDSENNEIDHGYKNIGFNTNNVAEYTALYLALILARKKEYNNIIIKGDSMLVINQLKGVWKVKNANLKKIYDNIKNILKNIASYKLLHVKRNLNKRADQLANIAMDEK